MYSGTHSGFYGATPGPQRVQAVPQGLATTPYQSASKGKYSHDVQESLDFIARFCKGEKVATPRGTSGLPPRAIPQDFQRSTTFDAVPFGLASTAASQRVALAAEINNQVDNSHPYYGLQHQPTPIPSVTSAGPTPLQYSDWAAQQQRQYQQTNTTVRPTPFMSAASAPAEPLKEPWTVIGGPGGARSVSRTRSPESRWPATHESPPRLEPQPTHFQHPAHLPLAAPIPKQATTTTSSFKARDSHQLTLSDMATYLKNHYAQADDETQRGLETMTDDDVFGLCQCFYTEVYQLVKAMRNEQAKEPAIQLQHMPSYAEKKNGPPIEVDPLQPAAQSLQQPPAPAEEPQYQRPAQVQVSQQSVLPAVQMKHAEEQRQPSPPLQHPTQPPSTATQQQARSVTPQLQQPRAPTPQQQPPARAPTPQVLPPPPRPSSRTATPAQDGVVSKQEVDRPVQRPQNQFLPLREAMKLMSEGNYVIKFGRNGKPQLRFITVQKRTKDKKEEEHEAMPHFCWGEDMHSKPSGAIPLPNLVDVTAGPESKNFKRGKQGEIRGSDGKPVDPRLCFTLHFTDRGVDLCCQTVEEYQIWFGGMSAVLERNQQMEQRARQQQQ